jgi:colanic acid biosynthesis glycosyl transferase WcaI
MTESASGAPAKVVFLNRFFYPDHSATSQMLSDLAFSLVRNGFEIHIVCSRQRYSEPRARLPARETIHGVVVHRVWTTRFGRHHLPGRALDYLSFYLFSAWRAFRLLRRGDVVVAKTDPPMIATVAMIAASLKHARLVNWLQDIFPEVAWRLGYQRLPRFANSLIRRLRDATLRAADMNVVLGERMYEFVAQLGIQREKIRIIANWANADAIPNTTAQSLLRIRLELRAAFIVGYSGNLGRAHEYHTVLEAAAILRGDRDIVFLMIGAGVGLDGLQQAVRERGLENFRFLAYQSRETLADSLAAADVHWLSLLPELEGLIVPSKLYGILAAQRPAIFIGDPDGEAARIIDGAHAGIAVAPGNGVELARQIARLKSDVETRESMGLNGHRLYREKFAPEIALAHWQAVLSREARVG